MRAEYLLVPALALISGCASPHLERPDSYMVFFDTNSALLSPEGTEAVANAAEAIRIMHPAHVVIQGPKTIDAAGFDTNLSEPRINVVEQALIADGVNHSLLSRASLNGQEAAPGAGGNRRIEIKLLKN